jgi:transposase
MESISLDQREMTTKGRAREGKGFAAKHFLVDWEQHRVTCPTSEKPASGGLLMSIGMAPRQSKSAFRGIDCQNCPYRQDCTKSQTKYPRRLISIHPEEHYHALRHARDRAMTLEYKQEYAHRAGIEGTISQAVRTCEVRRSRYPWLSKTALQHLLTATALNLLRMGTWLTGEPLAQTRHARFFSLLGCLRKRDSPPVIHALARTRVHENSGI